MAKSSKDECYSEAEAARRRDAIVRNMIATPPKPHEPLKNKRTTNRKKSTLRKRKKVAAK